MTSGLNYQDFIPDMVLDTAVPKEDLQCDAFCKSSEAVLLFVDMSGFSRIASNFVTQSERGAEGLRELVNSVFDMVVASINAHGGRVLYYAGDAVNATWSGSDADKAHSVHRTLACGLDIQLKCKDLPDAWQTFGIEMKAHIHHGFLSVLDVDIDAGTRQALICGQALEELADLPSIDAGKGVAISDALYAAVEHVIGEATLTQVGDDTKLVTAIGAPDLNDIGAGHRPKEDHSAYLHPHVRSSIALGIGDWLAEFRNAQVLFVRLPAFQFTGSDDLAQSANVLRSMCHAIDAQGGTLMQICNDDKGLVCIAAWGLAKSSFENDAARAVLAAQTITQELGELGFNSNAAITQGKIFAGLLGARPLLQHSIVGDVLSRAASIAVQNKAPVVLDEASYKNLSSEFDCARLGEIQIKGQDDKVPIFTPSTQKIKTVQHHGDFVGRKVERGQLADHLRDLIDGRSDDIRIVAQAGLGKSRLAAWFEERARAEGLKCLRMNADQLRQASSYLPMRQVFDALFEWPDDVSVAQCIERLTALMQEQGDALTLLPLLNPILPIDLPETENTMSLVGAGRAELTRSTIVALLQKLLEENATLLIVEDAHWLDSASWLCIEAAKRDIANLSLLIVTRPLDEDQIPTEAKKLITPDEAALHLEIGPLTRDDTAAIVRQTLNATDVSDRISDLVFKEAAGHPLYTNALAASLVERGLIRMDKGYAHLQLGDASVSSIAFPQGVKGVISERISGLDLERQLTIKTAAVLGRNFDIENLRVVYPVAERSSPLVDLVAGLTEAGLIDDLGDARFRFHHAIIMDCAHEMLTTQQQHALHRVAGEKIETDVLEANQSVEQTQLALMAYHFEHADQPAKAMPYLAQAAQASRRNYGNVETVDFLTRALALAEAQGGVEVSKLQQSKWYVQIAESLRALGQYQRAEDFLQSAISTLEKPAPQTAMQALAQLLREFAKFKLKPHRIEQPSDIREPIITAADANMMLSEIHYELNKIPFALSEILKGANLARKAGGDSETLSKLYIGMALISTSLPWALDGDDLQQKSLDIADRLEDPATPSWVYMVSGVYNTGKGRWQSGEAQLNKSSVMAEQCGERKTWETAMSCLGNHKRLEGYFETAKGWSDLTMQASRERGIDHGIIWSHNGRARDLLCLSQFEELREDVAALERLLNDPTKTGDSNDNNNLVYYYAKAFCALKDGQNADAMADFTTVIEMLKSIKRPQVYMIQNVDYYCDIIWNLWQRGHRGADLMEQQKRVAKSGKQVAKQYRTGAPMALLAEGDGAWFKADAKAAETHWRASAKAAQERDMPYNEAHALFRLAQTGLGGDEWRPVLAKLGIERPLIWAFDH